MPLIEYKFIQNIVILKFFLHCILLSLMFEILLNHNWYLNLQLDGNINSVLIAHPAYDMAP